MRASCSLAPPYLAARSLSAALIRYSLLPSTGVGRRNRQPWPHQGGYLATDMSASARASASQVTLNKLPVCVRAGTAPEGLVKEYAAAHGGFPIISVSGPSIPQVQVMMADMLREGTCKAIVSTFWDVVPMLVGDANMPCDLRPIVPGAVFEIPARGSWVAAGPIMRWRTQLAVHGEGAHLVNQGSTDCNALPNAALGFLLRAWESTDSYSRATENRNTVSISCSPDLLLPCSPAPLLPCSPCSPAFMLPCSPALLLSCSPALLLSCSPAPRCSPAPLLPCSPAPLLSCPHALLLPCSPAPMLSCSHALMLSCSHALMLSCSHARLEAIPVCASPTQPL